MLPKTHKPEQSNGCHDLQESFEDRDGFIWMAMCLVQNWEIYYRGEYSEERGKGKRGGWILEDTMQ